MWKLNTFTPWTRVSSNGMFEQLDFQSAKWKHFASWAFHKLFPLKAIYFEPIHWSHTIKTDSEPQHSDDNGHVQFSFVISPSNDDSLGKHMQYFINACDFWWGKFPWKTTVLNVLTGLVWQINIMVYKWGELQSECGWLEFWNCL